LSDRTEAFGWRSRRPRRPLFGELGSSDGGITPSKPNEVKCVVNAIRSHEVMADSPIGQHTTQARLSTSPRPLNGTTFGKGSPRIPPSASPFPIHRTGWVSVGRFLTWFFFFPKPLFSLRLHIIGFGENPTCTRLSNIHIFINPILFRDNMTDSIIEKIRKAAEARDKAINEQAQKGFCAPCDEPLESCMCDAYEAMAGEE